LDVRRVVLVQKSQSLKVLCLLPLFLDRESDRESVRESVVVVLNLRTDHSSSANAGGAKRSGGGKAASGEVTNEAKLLFHSHFVLVGTTKSIIVPCS
jgi:hypothetical protein